MQQMAQQRRPMLETTLEMTGREGWVQQVDNPEYLSLLQTFYPTVRVKQD
jgi:hypothetical protein